MEQAVNNVLMLKSFVTALKPVWQTLMGVRSVVLQQIREVWHTSVNTIGIDRLSFVIYTITPKFRLLWTMHSILM